MNVARVIADDLMTLKSDGCHSLTRFYTASAGRPADEPDKVLGFCLRQRDTVVTAPQYLCNLVDVDGFLYGSSQSDESLGFVYVSIYSTFCKLINLYSPAGLISFMVLLYYTGIKVTCTHTHTHAHTHMPCATKNKIILASTYH